MSLKDTALNLLAQGFRPIPLGGYDEQPPAYFIERNDGDIDKAREKWPKTPRISWRKYQEQEPTEQEVELWWTIDPNSNIGILTGFEVYVVDADSKESAEWVENNLTFTPWRVETGNGRHFYYAVGSGELNLQNFVNLHGKVDVRGVGGYVVAAGSRHPSGTYYADAKVPGVASDHYNDLPELTTDDVQRIKYANNIASRAPTPGSYGNMAAVKAVGETVQEVPTVEGARNSVCASLVGKLIRQQYSRSEILERLTSWNEGNQPPLSTGDIERTIDSVIQTHEMRGGHNVPVVPLPEKNVSELMFSYGQLVDDPPAAVEHFWPGNILFRGARVMIAGAPKIGKSRFTLAMLVQGAIGGKFLDHSFAQPLKCMWMQAEIHRSFLMERIQQVTPSLSSRELALLRDNLTLSGRLDLDVASERDYGELRKQLEHYRPDIWAIDPIIDFSSAEENSNVEVRGVLRRINALATEFECAVVLVHHTRKSGTQATKGQSSGFDQIRGASAFRGWFDTGIMLTGEQQTPIVSWEVRNAESPGAHGAAFNPETGLYTAELIEDPEVRASDKKNATIFWGQCFRELEQAGGTMSFRALIDRCAQVLRLDETAVRHALAEMVRCSEAFMWHDEHGEQIVYASRQANPAAYDAHAAQFK